MEHSVGTIFARFTVAPLCTGEIILSTCASPGAFSYPAAHNHIWQVEPPTLGLSARRFAPEQMHHLRHATIIACKDLE